uniref:Neurotransmitter-gated ion-channel ligand-binding domain-containing protein n=1 Tax=Panagrolaimus sp. PS1159 TaxID=55785 RepID=A0AC35GT71_9BILA
MLKLGLILLLYLRGIASADLGIIDPVKLGSAISPHGPDCSWRHNITDEDLLTAEKQDVLESCLYYYLVEKDIKESGDSYKIWLKAPWEYPLKININSIVIQQVDSIDKKAAQFNIHGEFLFSWKDDRLEWNSTEWKMDSFFLHDTHHIWTPLFTDESSCTTLDGCISKVTDVEVHSDGKIEARLIFRYPSYCAANYYNYPEETNDCCLFLSIAETERNVEYVIGVGARGKDKVNKQVAITDVQKEKDMTILTNVETSAWTVLDRTIDTVKISGYRTNFIKICIHAKKDMNTLRVALRIPTTIATLLMLAAPLFGDLRTQSFVKLTTLLLQTICFLFLCSIAPENGFGGHKPKIYSFYEFLFVNSAISIIITLIALALCRVKRNVPPSHNLFLTAKLINRFLCCVEPDPTTAYTRYLDDRENGGIDQPQRSATDPSSDYTTEWRHLYIAANNLLSGINFTIFCFIIFFDIL